MIAQSDNLLKRPLFIYGLLGLICLGLFILTFRAPVSQANGDARLSLLVSLAILEQGSVKLDAYDTVSIPPLSDPDNKRQIVEQNGHLYYSFPLGSSLLSVPPVWLATVLGRDLTIVAEQNRLQNGLAALSTAFIFLLLFTLARTYLSQRHSLFLALVMMLGSMLISTLGTALWSHHAATIAILCTLLLATRQERGQWSLRPWQMGPLMGLTLFGAYLARPSTAVFICMILIYLWLWQRPVFGPTALVAAALFGLFLLWSQSEFGSWFPFYYRPERLDNENQASLLTALYGQLLSPSRGLFLFVPYLGLILAFALWCWRKLETRRWLAFALIWAALQLIVSYRAAPWWSGFSFGPRIQLDFWPGLILLTIIIWPRFLAGRYGRIRLVGFTFLALFAIWIHSYQGLFNIQTTRWNGILPPTIDQEPELAFDWSFPQIGATNQMICQRNRLYLQTAIDELENTPLLSYDPIDLAAAVAQYPGWTEPAGNRRWSQCEQSDILFYHQADLTSAYELVLEIQSLGVNQVPLTINDHPVATIQFEEPLSPQLEIIPVNGNLLQSDLNRLSFSVSGAGTPTTVAPFSEGIGLTSWSLRPAELP